MPLIIAIFSFMVGVGVTLPERYYYPKVDLTAQQRELCNKAADNAYEARLLQDSDKGFARAAEVDAFEACAKAAGK